MMTVFWLLLIPNTILAFIMGPVRGLLYGIAGLILSICICVLILFTVASTGTFFSLIMVFVSLFILSISYAISKGDMILTLMNSYGFIVYCIASVVLN